MVQAVNFRIKSNFPMNKPRSWSKNLNTPLRLNRTRCQNKPRPKSSTRAMRNPDLRRAVMSDAKPQTPQVETLCHVLIHFYFLLFKENNLSLRTTFSTESLPSETSGGWSWPWNWTELLARMIPCIFLCRLEGLKYISLFYIGCRCWRLKAVIGLGGSRFSLILLTNSSNVIFC